MDSKFKKSPGTRSVGAVVVLAVLAFTTLTDPYPASAAFEFGPATNLGSTVNTAYMDTHPSISADGLSLYFTSDWPGDQGHRDLWMTTRPTEEDDWETPTWLGATVNSSANDGAPCISPDGLSLYFGSDRAGGRGDGDLYVTTRSSKSDPWAAPMNLGPPVNSWHCDSMPSISLDGLSLFFLSYPAGRPAEGDIFVTTRASASDSWGTPVNLGPTVNSSVFDGWPNISPDGCTLLFASERTGGAGYLDLWMTTRPTPSDPWGAPLNLGSAVNSGAHDFAPSISADGSTLYFTSNRSGGFGDFDLWQVAISPVVDLNADGVVNFKDLSKLSQSWQQNERSVDVGPTPIGDGIVDSRDVAVLAEDWLTDFRLIAHWKLDETEGGIAHDSIGGKHGYAPPGLLWRPDDGAVGGALELDGVDDSLFTTFTLNPVDTSFSVFAWVKGGAPGQVILFQTGGPGPTGGCIWLGASAEGGNLVTGLTFPIPLLHSDTVVTDGQWHHVGLVWDRSQRCLYVDGQEVARDAALMQATAHTGGLYIGAASNLEAGTFWEGLIDDIRVYDQAPPADEIQWLARRVERSGGVTDSNGVDDTITTP